MPITLSLHVFARATDEAQLKRVLAQMLGDQRERFELTNLERYWKIQGMFDVSLLTTLKAATPGDAIVEAFEAMRVIDSRWRIAAPQFFTEGRFEVHGSAEKPQSRVFALESVDFYLTNEE